MSKISDLINAKERSLKLKLNYLHKELKKSQQPCLATLVPSYEVELNEEIHFVQMQLNKIKNSRKLSLTITK